MQNRAHYHFKVILLVCGIVAFDIEILDKVDIEFNNAAGFIGEISTPLEGQFMVYFLSHSMLFCSGALIESHIVLTAASCVYAEHYKFQVYAGSHDWVEGAGVTGEIVHLALHKGFNTTRRWRDCPPNNVALLMMNTPFSLSDMDASHSYAINRVRYGIITHDQVLNANQNCKMYGWGSRRNGFLIPLLLRMRTVNVDILAKSECDKMWNFDDRYLCLRAKECKSVRHGALCPDDAGSVIECSGFLRGLMVSHALDRPCGIGFLDTTQYLKFMTCGVDDSRDIIANVDYNVYDFGATTPFSYKPSKIVNVEELFQDKETTVSGEVPDEKPAKGSAEPNEEANVEAGEEAADEKANGPDE